MQLLINIFFLFFLFSCDLKNNDNLNSEFKKEIINLSSPDHVDKLKTLKYVLGASYFISGVEYIPQENYSYDQIGLASYYGKELHNQKTLNNDLNKVTGLLARHKTLPLPSVVKVTNLDNGLSLIVKINDRHEDNSSIIQVSRKTAQLLKFYKNKIAKVRVQILSDASKQQKVVTLSMSDPAFDNTIEAAPTIGVFISDMEEEINTNSKTKIIQQPIQIGLEEIENKDLYLKVYDFTSYVRAKSLISELKISHKFSTQNEGSSYSVIIGPLNNLEANNLVLSFISRGYKNTELILE